MNIIELAKYLLDEDAAEEYLLSKGILKNFTVCPYCGSPKIGKIRRGRMKCYKCKKEWHRRKGSILESRHITYSKFVGVIKLFSYGFGVNRMAYELEIDIKSMVELVSSLRKVIGWDYARYFNIEFSEIFLATTDKNEVIVGLSGEEIKAPAKLTVERLKSFDKSFSYKIRLNWIEKKEAQNWNTIHRFVSYIKIQLLNYRGINSKYFNEYFFELLFRFNNIDKDLLEIMLEKLRI